MHKKCKLRHQFIMKRNTKKRLETAWKDINSICLTQPMVVRLFSIYGGNREKAVLAYQNMEKSYGEYLKKNGLINPGCVGVPNKIALPFLERYGITKATIKEALEAEGWWLE